MRGEIRNERYAKQLKNFGGLNFGKGITPTDIDGFVEFGDKLFVFIELKYVSPEDQSKLDDLDFCLQLLHKGQRWAYERLCDALQDAGKISTVLLAWHEMEPEQQIPAGRQWVIAYRYQKTWHEPDEPIRVYFMIRKFLKTAGLR